MNNPHNTEHWRRLIERYFDADTSETEEEALRRMVGSPLAQSEALSSLRHEIDEVRALMSYAAAVRRSSQQHVRRKDSTALPAETIGRPAARRPFLQPWRGAAAAAVMAAVVGGGMWLHQWRHPDYIAYIDGKRVTDAAIVQHHMEQTLRAALAPDTDDPTVESQLQDVFATLHDNHSLN